MTHAGRRLRRVALPTLVQAGILVTMLAAWIAINVAWYLEHRAGQPKNIDELGYYSIALNNSFGLEAGGIPGWFERLASPTIQAPLTTALASLVLPLAGDAFAAGVGVVMLLGALTIALLFITVRTLAGPSATWLVTIGMATIPLFVQMSRQFAFAVPLCAVVMAALAVMLRSHRFERTGVAVAFGVLLGLVPLTRTMGAGFVPAFAIIAIAMALATREGRARRFRNVVIAGVVSAIVAVPWYAANWGPITDYLTQYGYGDQAAAYAGEDASLAVDVLSPFLGSMLLAHLLVLAAGWACAAVVLARRVRRGVGPLGDGAWAAIASAGIVVGGLVALATTSNDGTGFGLPLVAPALVVVALGFDRLLLVRRATRRTVAAATAAGLVIVSSGYFGVATAVAEERTVPIAGGGSVTLTDGTNDDQAYPFDSGIVGGDETQAAAWRDLTRDLVDAVVQHTPTSIAFGFRGAFINVNGFQVGAMQDLGYPLAIAQIDPLLMHGEADYLEWLESGAAAGSCVLATSRGTTNEFPPYVDQDGIEAAAADAGFERFDALVTPDRRTIELWSRDLEGCPDYLEAQMLP